MPWDWLPEGFIFNQDEQWGNTCHPAMMAGLTCTSGGVFWGLGAGFRWNGVVGGGVSGH